MSTSLATAPTHDMFLVAQRVSRRFNSLKDTLGTLFQMIGATRLRSVDVYYRRQTDVALLALHLDAAQLSPAQLSALEGSAMRGDLAVLEPARLPDAERARFFESYLPQYELRLQRLAAPDDAMHLLEEHLVGIARRAQAAAAAAAGPVSRAAQDKLEVRFRRGDAWQLGRVRSLSRDSLYVSTGGPPRRGDVVEIALALGPAQLLVRAGVLQVTPADAPQAMGAPGFGAQFLVGDLAEADRVERFLAHVRAALPSELTPPPRRRDVRYPVCWPVFVAGASGQSQTSALDMSLLGMFVAATVADGASAGQSLELTLPLDDGGSPMRAAARVARAIGPNIARQRGVPTGLGLEIVALGPRESARFSRFLTRVGKRTSHTLVVGAAVERAGPIVQELIAAGYSAAQVLDPAALLARASASRPPDLVLLDATLTRADPKAEEAVRRALTARRIPLQHIGEDTPAAVRALADMTLLS
jgi:hypothetical protein